MKEGTAYYGDCFDIISNWEEKGFKEVADLIYGDPPFNSNRNYGAPTSKAQETDTGSMDAFVDMWTYDDKAIARTKRICKSVAHPASRLIQSLKDWLEEEDDGMLAYLSYMADRLWTPARTARAGTPRRCESHRTGTRSRRRVSCPHAHHTLHP